MRRRVLVQARGTREWPIRGPLPMVRRAQPRWPDHWLSRAASDD